MSTQITDATPAGDAVRSATSRSIDPAGPDLTMYRAVHVAIRQAAHRLADAAADTDARDARRVTAIARYWTGYAGEVLAHHTVEDEVFFPALRDRVPSAVTLTDRTDADHEHLDELMNRCRRAIGHLSVSGARSEAVAALRALAAHMDEHLAFEDAEMLPLVAQVFTREDYEALEHRALEIVGTGKQAMFTVPFIAATLTPTERAAVLATAPRAMRIVYRLTRRGHARLAARVFGSAAGKAVA